jgi:hypothetical protein
MTITTTKLTRAAGLSAVAGGLLFIAVQIKHPQTARRLPGHRCPFSPTGRGRLARPGTLGRPGAAGGTPRPAPRSLALAAGHGLAVRRRRRPARARTPATAAGHL